MKLNFWQILGLLLVIVAVVLIARRETAKTDTPPAPAATLPS